LALVSRDAGSMLMHANNGGVDHLDSSIVSTGKRVYDAAPDTSRRQRIYGFWGCRIDFCFLANGGSIREAVPLCIRANRKNSFKHRLLTLAPAISLARRAA
jgi:hypothetical protein